MKTPAEIIKKLLTDEELAPNSKTSAWAPFVSHLPDSPESAIVIYDTAGTQNGRMMRGGEKIEHPGVQIRLRSPDYPSVWNKANDVADFLDGLEPRTEVIMSPTETWVIQNISRTGNILVMGIEEEGDRRRHNFAINAILTLRHVYTGEFVDFQVESGSRPGFFQDFQVLNENGVGYSDYQVLNEQ